MRASVVALQKFIAVHNAETGEIIVYPPEVPKKPGDLFFKCYWAADGKKVVLEELWDEDTVVMQFSNAHYWATFVVDVERAKMEAVGSGEYVFKRWNDVSGGGG
jgi:hypothetical protein